MRQQHGECRLTVHLICLPDSVRYLLECLAGLRTAPLQPEHAYRPVKRVNIDVVEPS